MGIPPSTEVQRKKSRLTTIVKLGKWWNFNKNKRNSLNKFANHPGYLRKSLVLATVEESTKPEYLHRILNDALDGSNVDGTSEKQRFNQYNVIKQYDVTKYNEKPFETE